MKEKEGQSNEIYELSRDGFTILIGTEVECLERLHQISPSSWDHSLKHEGYSLERMK